MYFWSVSLVYQLSGQFLIFLIDQIFLFGMPNYFLVYQTFFWSTKLFFWSTKFLFGIPNFFLVDQIFFCRPKKWEIDRTIGIPKRLTKSTWTPLLGTAMIFSVHIHAILKIILKITMGSFEKVRLAHCEIWRNWLWNSQKCMTSHDIQTLTPKKTSSENWYNLMFLPLTNTLIL